MAIAREAEPVGSLSEVREAGLDREDLLAVYRNLLLTRGIEERGHILYRQGKIPGSFYTGRGNEAASVGVATAMGPDDVGTPLHRDMGVHVVRGVEPWRIFAQYMGRVDGPTKGKDGNVHMAAARLGLIAMVSHLPAMLPVATGCALAFRIRGEKRVAVGWYGEGASARGDCHEAMNLAGTRRLPIVFVCDNNQWAYSTPSHLEYATEHVADRAEAYGFEDVGVYGGAFKVTLGFQEEFGPWRVIDAPLAESAIIGACTGASIMGMRPVAEMQFADFISCGWDQLVTVAAKQRWRAGTPVPITVRLPSGGGFSGGPFHSQNPESSFAHIPGLKVVCPATPADAKGLLIEAIQDPNPVLYFEHKHLYRRIKDEVPEERYTVPFGEARVHREGDDITVVTWGAMVYTAAEAAKQLEGDDVSVEILDLRSVAPWDKQAVLESVRKTSKVLVLHEDTHTGGFGAEIAATISEEGFENLDAPVKRITAPDTPVPFSPPLEKAFIPQVEDVVAGLTELAEY